MKSINVNKQEYFINRELSWLEFNHRVLEEAKDRTNPLFERFKFLSIVSSNLDEFFMVRVAALKDQVNADYSKRDSSGLTPKRQLQSISNRVKKMVYDQYNAYNRSLIPMLKKQGVYIVSSKDLGEEEKKFIEQYFKNIIFPVLTPIMVNPNKPFPMVLGKSLNIALLIKGRNIGEKTVFAIVQVPSILPRLIEFEKVGTQKRYMLLEEIIKVFIGRLFVGHDIISSYCFRVTRNADLTIEEEEAEDLLKEIEESLKRRKNGAAIRLEVESSVCKDILDNLKRSLEIHDGEIYRINGPLDLSFLNTVYSIDGYETLKYPPHVPKIPEDLLNEGDVFSAIRKKDILLFHPYESFEPVVEFINKAANDPDVLAVKQTLYRVSGDSPIIESLTRAAKLGKQVTVLVEVKARFDEENNIQWAKKLEQAGCHVIYGIAGYKTHCKIALVVRMECNEIKRYVHMSTGNYNDITAKFYTDIGLFTCEDSFGEDATSLFNMLTGYSTFPSMNKLYMAPFNLKSTIITLIKRETINASIGKEAKIIIKMNALVDSEIIDELYKASLAGVKIELIIRGICCLRSGVSNLSENIKVRSIVGRFLEHTRLLYFYNDGEEKVYITSADLMPRNLYRRIELMFNVEDESLKTRLVEMLNIVLKDTVKTRVMMPNGLYKKVDRRGKETLDSQSYFVINS